MLTGKFIIEPFNVNFFIMLGVTALFCFLFILAFRKTSERTRRAAVAVLYGLTIIFFFVYKIWLGIDPEYSDLRVEGGLAAFNFWDELPLNLCNINMILIFIGVLTNSRLILGLNFFIGSLGALFPILMPIVGFHGYSFFFPRMLGYYITHLVILCETPILAGLNLFRPKFRDVLPTFGFFFILTAFTTGINYLFRFIGVSDSANYFYTMNPAGNPILELLYKYIPIPGVYVLPVGLVVLPYMFLVTALFQTEKKKRT